MNVGHPELSVARIAAAIGEPARARILFCLLDGHARTSTELSAVAEVTPSTTSVHLNRLTAENLLRVSAQGKHRYYSLEGNEVASALEALSNVAGGTCRNFVPNTPTYLRAARTCYDHIAGNLGVQLCDRLKILRWLTLSTNGRENDYQVTQTGAQGFAALGIDIAMARSLRRRLAFACLDWSERKPHLGGALAAELLKLALKRKWVAAEPGSRALAITRLGRREMLSRFGVEVQS
ncbi:MAG: helix-turn-helix transcriptional regulator [Acidobacteriaceae bacterium]|nr:helix-turn-helix transcriptional regulator [Acidobacteriaceae bacterium]